MSIARRRRQPRPGRDKRDNNPLTNQAPMSARPSKTGTMLLAILMGVVTCWQGVLAFPSGLAAPTAPCVRKCCRCANAKCGAPGCCSKSSDNRAPFLPASSAPISPNDWQAPAMTAAASPALLSTSAAGSRTTASPSAPVTAVPLFQRDCCYLI
jgi:hypothetical protein